MVIRIKDLPTNNAPAASQFVATDLATTEKLTIQGVVDTGAPVASQAEAEAGVNNTKRMTPLTTAQAIAELGASAAQGALADTAVQPGDLSAVATSGNYNDLSDQPSLSADLIYPTKADAQAATIPLAEEALRINGDATVGDGLGGLYIDTDNGSADTFDSSGGTARTWYRAPDVGDDRIIDGRVLMTDAERTKLGDFPVWAEVAKRIIEFDARDSQFAGGVTWDDSADDTPAIAAAITYFQTLGGLNQYEGQNAAVLRLPRGVGRVSNLDLTLAQNVTIAGLSDGSTTIRNVSNNTCMKTTNVAGTNDLFRLKLRDFTIIGPGRANTSAFGIDFFAVNNGGIYDVRVYSCHAAMRFRNNWQTQVVRPMIDGGVTVGSLSCMDGIQMLDGTGSVVENCIKVNGGIISGIERYGFRGESVTGSEIIGLEMLACGSTAMYIGDSPGGKDLKWFSVVGCIFDSSGDLIVVNKGTSTVAEQMHFSGLWLGNANAGSGQGEAIKINGLEDCSFQADLISNVDIAFSATNCSRTMFDYRQLNDYDKSLVGAVPIQLTGCTGMSVRGGPTIKTATSPSTLVLVEASGTDVSNIQGINGDGGMTIIGANSIVKGNNGFKTRNSGTATILNGTSSIVVNHGLGRTPTNGDIMVTPLHLLTSAGVAAVAVDTLTATQFTIRVNANVSASIGFNWQADVSRG